MLQWSTHIHALFWLVGYLAVFGCLTFNVYVSMPKNWGWCYENASTLFSWVSVGIGGYSEDLGREYVDVFVTLCSEAGAALETILRSVYCIHRPGTPRIFSADVAFRVTLYRWRYGTWRQVGYSDSVSRYAPRILPAAPLSIDWCSAIDLWDSPGVQSRRKGRCDSPQGCA